MHRTVGLLLLLALVPLASAQAPDPSAAVAVACAAAGQVDPDVRDALPACAREEPAAQQTPAAAPAHEHPAPAGDAAAVVEEVQEAAQGVVEDPQSAPGRLAALVATVVQFVKDLLTLPVRGVVALGEGVVFVGQAVGSAAVAAWGGVVEAAAWVGSLFAPVADAPVEAPVQLPEAAPVDLPLGGLLDALPEVAAPVG